MPATIDYAAQLGAVTAKTLALALEVTAAAAAAGYPIRQLWGYNPASVPEHSSGRAVDFMVYGNRAAGDWIAGYLWTHRARLGLKWEIWQQRIRSTSPGHSGTWEDMADRGNATANHRDHVHAFFNDTYTPMHTSTPTGEPDMTPADYDKIADRVVDKLIHAEFTDPNDGKKYALLSYWLGASARTAQIITILGSRAAGSTDPAAIAAAIRAAIDGAGVTVTLGGAQ